MVNPCHTTDAFLFPGEPISLPSCSRTDRRGRWLMKLTFCDLFLHPSQRNILLLAMQWLSCQTTFTRSGRYPTGMRIFRSAGKRSRACSRVIAGQRARSAQASAERERKGSGSGDFGNIISVMPPISGRMWRIAISIRSNTGLWIARRIGHILRCTAKFAGGGMRRKAVGWRGALRGFHPPYISQKTARVFLTRPVSTPI